MSGKASSPSRLAAPRATANTRPRPVESIRFILAAKEVGFTLEEIAELLTLRVRRGESCSSVRQRAQARVADIDAKLVRLRKIRRTLARLIASCSGPRAMGDCAILEGIQERAR